MQMGMAMGQDPELLHEVCGWINGAAKVPVWAKMTPNITDITKPAAAALSAGCEGIAAINTIQVRRLGFGGLGFSSVALGPGMSSRVGTGRGLGKL